jgi:inositol-phosphate phosphatase / L-galactose 1-phosphate phosphatase / histidinol-phosphatase
MNADEIQAAIAFANRLADASGEIIRQAVSGAQAFITKSDNSPVTEIDRRVELELRTRIETAYPDHGILGEEYGPRDLDNEFVWVIDPIDGTKAFITGIPTYGTLIALAHRGAPILGVIDHPITNERWVGADGIGTTLNGRLVQARSCEVMAEAILTTGNPEPFNDTERDAFARLREASNWCVYGGGCLAYGRIASGFLDIGIECGHDAFDFCALVPVIRNAGGVITDWEGNPLTIHSGHRYVATGDAALHEQVLEILARGNALAA